VPEADRPKLARRGLALLLGAILLVPVPDRVRAPVSIEPLVRRAVTAPLQARIDSVAVEPGDRVAAGQTLLVLDSVPTFREREDAQASLQAAATQAASARADGDVESERLAQLRAAQVAAQLAVLDARLEEAVVRAPIAGTVTGEDLRRRIGASVGRGELLFSIAAPGGYRAELRVADSDIQRVQNGARVRLALAAEPLSRRSATVIRIFPLAEVVDGRNMFRTIARIDTDDSEGLSAGMAGSGAIRAGYSPLAWQLLRGPVRWVRLKVWV
jgi:multidrug efflux pump subunit AcrA (membrane-fusion protein)